MRRWTWRAVRHLLHPLQRLAFVLLLLLLLLLETLAFLPPSRLLDPVYLQQARHPELRVRGDEAGNQAAAQHGAQRREEEGAGGWTGERGVGGYYSFGGAGVREAAQKGAVGGREGCEEVCREGGGGREGDDGGEEDGKFEGWG